MRYRKIEREMKWYFPGWCGKIWRDKNGVHLETRGNLDFYYLYPGLSREEADAQIVKDIVSVIRQHIPGFELTGYEQHGQYITPAQGD